MRTDEHFIKRALRLAKRGEGFVEPNPMVGAVLVKRDKIISEAYHRRFGAPHAEALAIQKVGNYARGATLYLNLEPCSHLGKTPPCTEAILKAGIRRVVCAMEDPNPLVKGVEVLRRAGVEVEVGVLEEEARRLNAPFIKFVSQRRPFIIAKWAMSLDGKIATRTGQSRWISSEQSRRLVQRLRGRVDGIVVGIGTVLKDDPRLLARIRPRRIATRIVLDSRLRIPLRSELLRTLELAPILIVTTRKASSKKLERLSQMGVEVLITDQRAGRVDLRKLLNELGRRSFTKLLVEGGGTVLASFLEERLVDRVYAFTAPILIGGRNSPTPFDGRGFVSLKESGRAVYVEKRMLGRDTLLVCEFSRL